MRVTLMEGSKTGREKHDNDWQARCVALVDGISDIIGNSIDILIKNNKNERSLGAKGI